MQGSEGHIWQQGFVTVGIGPSEEEVMFIMETQPAEPRFQIRLLKSRQEGGEMDWNSLSKPGHMKLDGNQQAQKT